MTVSNSTDIHFDAGDVWHRWHAGDDECRAYGVLKIGRGDHHSNLYLGGTPELIDTVIAELVALRAEMTGEPDICESAYMAPGVDYYCSLDAGHPGLHAQLTGTGAFIAEWGYEDGHVHTTSGHQPAPELKAAS